MLNSRGTEEERWRCFQALPWSFQVGSSSCPASMSPLFSLSLLQGSWPDAERTRYPELMFRGRAHHTWAALAAIPAPLCTWGANSTPRHCTRHPSCPRASAGVRLSSTAAVTHFPSGLPGTQAVHICHSGPCTAPCSPTICDEVCATSPQTRRKQTPGVHGPLGVQLRTRSWFIASTYSLSLKWGGPTCPPHCLDGAGRTDFFPSALDSPWQAPCSH